MYKLLVRLMLIAALLQLGWTVNEFASCRSMACIRKVERDTRRVLAIDWKPISVFPEEAKRFR